MMLRYEPMLDSFHFLKTTGFDSLCIYVKIESILDFTTNMLLTRTILGVIFFPRKKKNQLSCLMVFTNSRTTNFLGQFSQVEFQNFEYLFFCIYKFTISSFSKDPSNCSNSFSRFTFIPISSKRLKGIYNKLYNH